MRICRKPRTYVLPTWRVQIFEWVVSDIWMGCMRCMSESCRTYEWVVPDVRMSRVGHMNVLYHMYEWVVSDIWMGCTRCMNESCVGYTNEAYIWRRHAKYVTEDIYDWDISQIWMRHVKHKEACQIYEWGYIWLGHITNMNEAYHIYRVAKTHRMPSVAGHFLQKSHRLQGSFAEHYL